MNKNPSNERKQLRKIIWAVDPRESETKPSQASVAEFRRWASDLGCVVQPVTVLSPTITDMTRGLLGSVTFAEGELASFLKAYNFPQDCEGRVLVNESASRVGAVSMLMEYAAQTNTAAIAVSSHGRSGLDRLTLGSFAEKILESSPWPVLFLTQREAASEGVEKHVVLFPTNFSAESHLAFQQFLRSTAGSGVDVVLFHAIAYPLPVATPMGMYLPDGYMEEQEVWAKKEGARWAEEAARENFKARAVVRAGGIGFLNGQSILAAAKEFNVCTIVMTATSGPVGRILLGSPAFDVFRANRFLSMVFGPKALEPSKTKNTAETQPNARA